MLASYGVVTVRRSARPHGTPQRAVSNGYSDTLYAAAIKRAETAEARCVDLEGERDHWQVDSYTGWGKARYWELMARNFRHDIINLRWIIDIAKVPHAPFGDIDIPPLENSPAIGPEQYAEIAHDKKAKEDKA